jgi:predicted nucleic acid-binding protein
MLKKVKLSHKPIKSNTLAISRKEELEMMEDILLLNISLYEPAEIASAIKEKITSLNKVEELLTPSNS